MKYSFVIDEKSLFRGVKNDYKKGQSATVHTPLNQSQDKNKWRNDIYDFLKGCESEDKVDSLPELLKAKCLQKTTSKASGQIVHFYVFSNFTLDGVPFDAESSFAMYVKEETSKSIVKRNGLTTANTHLGRHKQNHHLLQVSCLKLFCYQYYNHLTYGQRLLDSVAFGGQDEYSRLLSHFVLQCFY